MILRYIAAVNRLIDWLGALASALLIGLVLLMTFNVLARYAFNSSSLGLEELSWHFYSSVFLLGIPYALKHGAHVRVDLLFERFSKRTQLLIDLWGTAIFLIPSCLVIIWAGWHFTAASYQLGIQPSSASEFFSQLVSNGIGERSQDSGGLLNRWIIKGVIPLSFVFLLLAAVSLLLEKSLALKSASFSPHSGAPEAKK
mgnify:FL=1